MRARLFTAHVRARRNSVRCYLNQGRRGAREAGLCAARTHPSGRRSQQLDIVGGELAFLAVELPCKAHPQPATLLSDTARRPACRVACHDLTFHPAAASVLVQHLDHVVGVDGQVAVGLRRIIKQRTCWPPSHILAPCQSSSGARVRPCITAVPFLPEDVGAGAGADAAAGAGGGAAVSGSSSQ
jgi:hypothetical protein